MPRYVAFLRGINLGPTNKVSMPRLRELAEGLGYTDVVTYINSGNLILTATDPAATIEQRLHAAIADELGLTVDVAVRTPARLATIVADNPFPDGDPSYVTVAFLTKAVPAEAKRRMAEMATDRSRTCSPARRSTCTTSAARRGPSWPRSSPTSWGSARPSGTIRTVTKVLELAVRE